MNQRQLEIRKRIRDQFPRLPARIVDDIVQKTIEEDRNQAEAQIEQLKTELARLQKEGKMLPAAIAEVEADAVGCRCSECGHWQKWTPSGMVCRNGHGGARGINKRLYSEPPAGQQYKAMLEEISAFASFRPDVPELQNIKQDIDALIGSDITVT